MSSNKEKNTKNRIIVSIILIVCIGIFAFLNQDCFKENPFKGAYKFSAPSNVFVGKNGQMYLIDEAKKKVIITDSELKYASELRGGSLADDFYYASLVCDDADGNIYIADVVYTGCGTQIGSERIMKYDKKGKYIATLFEQDYDAENAPFQYGNILELKEENGTLQFLVKEEGAIGQYVLEKGDIHPQMAHWIAEYDMSDVAYDSVMDRMIICTRQGNIVSLDRHRNEEILFEGNGTEIPWNVTVDKAGNIYYTELVSCGIFKLTDGAIEEVTSSDYSYYTIDQNDAGMLATTDFGGICYQINGEEDYLEDFVIKNVVYRCAVWIITGAGALYALLLLIILVAHLVKRAKDQEQVIRVTMILVASLLCSVTIIAMMLKSISESQDETVLQELSLFGTMMANEIDATKVKEITKTGDYKNEIYNEVKAPLDLMIDTGYNTGTYYYYIMYFKDGAYINAVMDYEESMTIHYPAYEWGDNLYTECMVEGVEKQSPGEASAYGTWTFVLEPIMDENGEVVALLEVGANMDAIEQAKKDLFVQVLFTTGTAVVVIIMLLMEILFMLGDMKEAKIDSENPTQFAPLRMTIFLIYLADSLQDAFIVQLCHRLYDGSLPISAGVASSLPISAELFMAAVFSLVAGRVVGKLGTKKNLIAGTVLCMLGFVLCGVWGSYYMILLGKTLVGMGMGIVYVSANTLAAKGRTEEECGKAFAGISAGVLSGITVGDGLGSIILSFASYNVVYIIAGCIMLVAFLLMLASRDLKSVVEKESASIKLPKFLFNWRVLPFFLLLLLPFMMMLSYREFFFPLYAEENGMNEVSIGRLFLICGLIVIYVGPALGEFLIKKLGSKKAVILASALMFVDTVIFMIIPTFTSAIIGVVILSIDISFAYACQYAYFATVPECDSYGEGNAMGIYSMIENVGQTVGPLVFGAVLTLGYRTGISIVGIGFGALLVFFLLTLIGAKKKKAQA